MRILVIVLTLALLLAGCATTGTVPVPVDPKCAGAPIYNSDFRTGLGETALYMAWSGAMVAISKTTQVDVKARFKGAAQRALQAARAGNLRAMGFALTSELGQWEAAKDYTPIAVAAVISLSRHYPDNQVMHLCDKDYVVGLCEDLVLLAS